MENVNEVYEWFSEKNVSVALIKWLEEEKKYEIIKGKPVNVHAHGIDIIANQPDSDISELIEVKGYPSEFYKNGPNKGKPNRTPCSLPAKHFFSDCLAHTIRNYSAEIDLRKLTGQLKEKKILVMAFPDYQIYREELKKIRGFFMGSNQIIKVYFVDCNGNVDDKEFIGGHS